MSLILTTEARTYLGLEFIRYILQGDSLIWLQKFLRNSTSTKEYLSSLDYYFICGPQKIYY